MTNSDVSERKKVFVSHSSDDKDFVRGLVDDLKELNLEVWFDEQSIGVGDSIPEEIEKGLKESDYVIAVLSRNSVDSVWVKRELDASLMSEDGLLLPIVIDDCEIPALLKARKYADFREDYHEAFDELAEVLTGEESDLPNLKIKPSPISECVSKLHQMKRSDLRRWIRAKLSRSQVSDLWRDLTSQEMNDDHPNSPLSECIGLLIGKMIKLDRHGELLEEICRETNP